MPGKGQGKPDNSASSVGTAGADRLHGSRANDVFLATAGNDVFNGKSGFDTVVYGGDVRDFDILAGGRDEVHGAFGSDTLINIDALQFDNAIIYLDGRNNSPVVDDASVNLDEDGGSVSVNVLDNAWDFEGEAVSLVSVDGDAFEGSINFDPETGEITFDIGDAYQDLGDGEILELDVNFVASDGTNNVNGTVSVTITGNADEAPAPEMSGWTFFGGDAVETDTGFILDAGVNYVSDTDAEAFLGLPTSLDAFAGGDAVTGGTAMTTITLDVAGTLSFNFDFSGSDETNGFFQDFAFITINGEPIMLEQFPSNIFGSQNFSIDLGPGTYEIGFGAFDMWGPFSSPTLIISDFEVTTGEAVQSSFEGFEQIVENDTSMDSLLGGSSGQDSFNGGQFVDYGLSSGAETSELDLALMSV